MRNKNFVNFAQRRNGGRARRSSVPLDGADLAGGQADGPPDPRDAGDGLRVDADRAAVPDRDAERVGITAPYVDEDTKDLVSSVVYGIHSRQGKFLGVAGIDIHLTELSERIQSIKITANAL